MTSTDPQRWARVLPGLARKHPGVPTEWTRVLERHPFPEGLSYNGYPMPGFVWLDVAGKVRHTPAGVLEFSEAHDGQRDSPRGT